MFTMKKSVLAFDFMSFMAVFFAMFAMSCGEDKVTSTTQCINPINVSPAQSIPLQAMDDGIYQIESASTFVDFDQDGKNFAALTSMESGNTQAKIDCHSGSEDFSYATAQYAPGIPARFLKYQDRTPTLASYQYALSMNQDSGIRISYSFQKGSFSGRKLMDFLRNPEFFPSTYQEETLSGLLDKSSVYQIQQTALDKISISVFTSSLNNRRLWWSAEYRKTSAEGEFDFLANFPR